MLYPHSLDELNSLFTPIKPRRSWFECIRDGWRAIVKRWRNRKTRALS